MTDADDFNARFEEILEDLVGLSDYACQGEERVTAFYVHLGLSEAVTYSPYFAIGEQIVTLTTLDETLGQSARPDSEIDDLQFAGLAMTRNLYDLFVDEDRETPYEARLVYDCQQESLDFALSYDAPKVGSTRTSARFWLESLRRGEDPLPAEEASTR